MILTKRQQSLFRGNSGSILAASARETADSVITALTPAAWYRNATGVTSAGGFASQWDDYSGNTRHIVQGTGTNQPAYSAGVFTFDGVDNYMKVTGGFTLNQPITFVLVVKQNSWTANDYLFDGNTDNRTVLKQNSVGASPQLTLECPSVVGPNSGIAVGSYGVLVAVANGASSVLRVNNNADVTGNAGANAAGGFTLGAAGGGTQGAAISVKEVVIFDAALSDANRSAVITALNNALTVF